VVTRKDGKDSPTAIGKEAVCRSRLSLINSLHATGDSNGILQGTKFFAKGGGILNTLRVIFPYKQYGVWAFDDPSVGLVREPFV
jgi:hypothetical protein